MWQFQSLPAPIVKDFPPDASFKWFSQFTFFVCKLKFLFDVNGSCPFLVSSLSWLQSDSSNKTTPAVTVAGWQSQSFSLANFNQGWQGSNGEKHRQSLHVEWWFLTEYEIETQQNTITGVKAVNSALLHSQGQQTVGWLCISLFAQSSRLWRKLGTKCWLEGIGLAEVYRMDKLSSFSPNLQEANLHSFVEHLLIEGGYDLNMCRDTGMSQEREKQIRENLNQFSSSLFQMTSWMHACHSALSSPQHRTQMMYRSPAGPATQGHISSSETERIIEMICTLYIC